MHNRPGGDCTSRHHDVQAHGQDLQERQLLSRRQLPQAAALRWGQCRPREPLNLPCACCLLPAPATLWLTALPLMREQGQ